jgi:hypothetical protein
MGQLMASDEAGTATTIVGGQPPGRGRRPLDEVPLGVEQVLYLAAMDAQFHAALLRDPVAAVDDRRLPLRSTERAMLAALPAEHLQAAVLAIDTSDDNVQRRTFMKLVAAGVMTVAAAEATAGCADDAATGIRPYDLSGPDARRDGGADSGPAPTGIRPDMPAGTTDSGTSSGK